MSAIAQKIGLISPEEYLEGELSSEVRHEYLDGYVYTRADASDDHSRVAGNILSELRERLRGKVFEVVSPQTERTDRREKAFAYREISTVQDYIIVEQDRVAMTVLHRAEEGWRSEALEGAEAILKLPVIGVEIPFSRIYERTALV
jgi:Uma2 family endonuclease